MLCARAAPDPPALFLRSIARYAGVHIYSDQADALFASSSLLAIHTRDDGERVIKLPRAADVTGAVTGEVVARQAQELRVHVRPFETRCWWID